MRYRCIDIKLWGDWKFRALSPLQPSGQALFIYLLSNPNTNSIPGIYRAGEAALAEELGWPLKAFREAFQEVLKQGLVKADFKARVIFIPNAIKYNKPQSPNVITSWASYWDEIPECPLKSLAYQALKAFVEGLGEAFAKAFEKAIGKTMPNQEQEQEQEQENKDICEVATATSPLALSENLFLAYTVEKNACNDEAQEIFQHWRKILHHPHAKLDKKRMAKITQALKLGYTVTQLKQAINGCKATPFNMGQNDRSQKYDGIDLIFRDAEHIERFISASDATTAPMIATGNDQLFAGVI